MVGDALSTDGTGVGLRAAARRWAQFVAAHDSLSRLTGQWARERGSAAAQRLFAEHSALHTEAMERWAARLPVIPAHPELAEWSADDLVGGDGGAGEASTVWQRLSIVDRALRDLEQRYHDEVAQTDRRLDAPTARSVELALGEVTRQRAEIGALLSSMR